MKKTLDLGSRKKEVFYVHPITNKTLTERQYKKIKKQIDSGELKIEGKFIKVEGYTIR